MWYSDTVQVICYLGMGIFSLFYVLMCKNIDLNFVLCKCCCLNRHCTVIWAPVFGMHCFKFVLHFVVLGHDLHYHFNLSMLLCFGGWGGAFLFAKEQSDVMLLLFFKLSCYCPLFLTLYVRNVFETT